MEAPEGPKAQQPLKPAAVVAALVLIGIVAFSCSGSCTNDETPRSSSTTSRSPSSASGISTAGATTETRNIKAKVSFSGTQFTITNLEARAWTNVRFEVNPGFISSGYTLKVQRVEAGTTYAVGAAQFANAAGERFNPFTHKPQEFHILEFSSQWPEQSGLEGLASFGWQ